MKDHNHNWEIGDDYVFCLVCGCNKEDMDRDDRENDLETLKKSKAKKQ